MTVHCDECGGSVERVSHVGPSGELECDCSQYLSLYGADGGTIWKVEAKP